MAHIPAKVNTKLWMKAGGRCEYRGCGKPLWRDGLTMKEMNAAYRAHIIGAKSRGPRGDEEESEKRAKDFDNLMLLCDIHHRLIDREGKAEHPPELLRRYKREHEERIQRQTGMQSNQRTHLLLFGSQIHRQHGRVAYEGARSAVLSEQRYPTTETGIDIRLNGLEISEQSPAYWEAIPAHLKRAVRQRVLDGKGPSGKPINHLSVFALAPIPALIFLGKQISDIVSADVYQRHRNTQSWEWGNEFDDDFSYNATEHHDLYEASGPEDGSSPADESSMGSLDEASTSPEDKTPRTVAVKLSLSGAVRDDEVARAMEEERYSTYTLRIERPHRDFLHAKEQLELFRNEWSKLLSKVRERHGEDCIIHLFPAVPCAVAVETGRALLPKSDPQIVIYDNDRRRGGFQRTLTV